MGTKQIDRKSFVVPAGRVEDFNFTALTRRWRAAARDPASLELREGLRRAMPRFPTEAELTRAIRLWEGLPEVDPAAVGAMGESVFRWHGQICQRD